MTVTLELTDEQYVQLLQGWTTYGLRCRLDGFESEAQDAHDLFLDLYEQGDGQLGEGE